MSGFAADEQLLLAYLCRGVARQFPELPPATVAASITDAGRALQASGLNDAERLRRVDQLARRELAAAQRRKPDTDR
ncbi:MAG TPA: hypothetical protein VME70_08190 [Mycobacteriales bacterium]|nr:hypothetical protein [Mycobacteriales bacterium]